MKIHNTQYNIDPQLSNSSIIQHISSPKELGEQGLYSKQLRNKV